MPTATLPLRTFRDPAPVGDDDALGEHLVALVRRALPRRSAAPVGVVVRGARVDLVDLREVRRQGLHAGLLLAALSRADAAVEAVGVMGVFLYRRTPADPGVPTALVFLEWADGRWWQWRGLVRPDPGDGPALLEETETVHRAVDGLPRPGGLGGWWTAGRRRRLRASLAPIQSSDVVH